MATIVTSPTISQPDQTWPHPEKRVNRKDMSLYEKLMYDLEHDPKVANDVALGKRIRLYRIRNQLGKGNFSKVKLGIHLLTKEKCAIKIIDKTNLDDKARKILSREISCMEKLCHPHLIRMYEVIESVQKLHIVMECASGGELADKIFEAGAYKEADAKPIFLQIAKGLQYMHHVGVIHRDLKAENVFFVSPTRVKVGDFGFSTLANKDDLLSTFCGSPPYAAPELFKDQNYNGPLVDIWALGVLLYLMLSTKLPFAGACVNDLKDTIIKGSFYMPTNFSSEASSLVKGMLATDPLERFVMIDILASTWLHGQRGLASAVDLPDSGIGCSKATLESVESSGNKELWDQMLKEVMEKLGEINIPTDDKDNLTDPREATGGMYRITLHQVMKKNGLEGEDDSKQKENDRPTVGTSQRQTKTDTSPNQRSKMCNIF